MTDNVKLILIYNGFISFTETRLTGWSSSYSRLQGLSYSLLSRDRGIDQTVSNLYLMEC